MESVIKGEGVLKMSPVDLPHRLCALTRDPQPSAVLATELPEASSGVLFLIPVIRPHLVSSVPELPN